MKVSVISIEVTGKNKYRETDKLICNSYDLGYAVLDSI